LLINSTKQRSVISQKVWLRMDNEIRRARLDTPDNFNHVIGQGIEMCRIANNFSDRKKNFI
jgi:hypothetical protein